MATTRRFHIRFNQTYKWLSSWLGMPPRGSFLEVDAEQVSVQMGWGFRARLPRNSVLRVSSGNDGTGLSLGIHGWNGRWLVNGSFDGIVKIELDPPQRAKVAGIPVRLRELRVSVDEPEDLVAQLSA
jgi:hypothetical protein